MIYRGDQLRAEPVWLEEWHKIEKSNKGETIFNANPLQFIGDGKTITAVKLDIPYKGRQELKIDGVFVEIGGVPGSSLVKPLGVVLDENGYIKVNEAMETNLPGLFAAGDITSFSAAFKQAIFAAGQGARAAASVYKYVKKSQAPQQLGV